MARSQMNPKSLANLKPAKKGEVRNPAGRKPKAKTIPDVLRRLGKEKIPTKIADEMIKMFPDASNMTMFEAIMRMTYLQAFKGQAWALQFIAERTEGKITQPISVSPFADLDSSIFDDLNRDDLLKLAGWKPRANSNAKKKSK